MRAPKEHEALFRPEVNDPLNRLGGPVRSYGVTLWAITGLLLAIFAAAVVFVATAQYQRKETVVGVVSPSAAAMRVTSSEPGSISEVFVAEGQWVERGTPLFLISTDIIGSDGRSLNRVLGDASNLETAGSQRQLSARAESLQRQIEELEIRRAGLVEEHAHVGEDIALQEERVRLSAATVEATRRLFDQQLIAAVTMRQREEAVLVARQALSATIHRREEVAIQLLQTAAQVRRLQADTKELDAQATLLEARTSEREASLGRAAGRVLVAPGSGTVAGLQGYNGGAFPAGRTLATVLPAGSPLQVELWVPSRAAGFIKRGDAVRIMYDAYPYQRFGVGHGTVDVVGNIPIAPADLASPVNTEEPVYRVTVRLNADTVGAYGKTWRLVPGMGLRADVVLDKRPLIDWLLDPVFALSRRQ